MKRFGLSTLAASICLLGSLASASAALGSGSISGSAIAADTGAPIAGLSVCAEENYVGGVSSGCTATDSQGRYRIDGLPAGTNYQVEFSAVGDLNYLTQYFQGKEGLGNWDPVTVEDGTTTEGVDAAMKPGAQISGYLTEEGTGAAAVDVEVCVRDPAHNPRAEEFERCTRSGQDGSYVVRSLPAGTYVVVFAPYRPPIDAEAFGEQYYAGTTLASAATPISIAPPETRYLVNTSLVNRLRLAVRRTGGFRTTTRSYRIRVGFRFVAGVDVRGYLCKRDRKPWRSCHSPQRFWASVGRHAFRLRAVSLEGVVGPVSSDRFRVHKAAKRRRG